MPATRRHPVGPQKSRPYAADYQCLNIAQNNIQSRAPHNKYFEVPRNVSSIFTGREDICRDLRERCLPSDPPSAQKTQKRYVLHGLGGSGKTQVCLKFAQDHRERYDNRHLILNTWESLSESWLRNRCFSADLFALTNYFLPQGYSCLFPYYVTICATSPGLDTNSV